MTTGADTKSLMSEALTLARKGKGKTAPNPCVGAVVVKDGQIIARGWHKQYGYPHAEVMALRDAQKKGYDLSQASLWVTLEPCNHYGQTPPCTQAIVEAGIKEVFVGTRDPNTNVAGGGIEYLRSQGVVVHENVEEKRCQDLIADFVVWQHTDRPYVLLKLASSLDGKIATRTGHSAWISGEESRQEVHRLRQQAQAVLIGGTTLYSDNPRLTSRLGDAQCKEQPLAVIVTKQLPESLDDLFLFRERRDHVLLWTSQGCFDSQRAKELMSQGIEIWSMPEAMDQMHLAPGLRRLRQEKGCYSILCEGGGRLALSLVAMNLVDEFHLFLAPKVFGDQEAVNSFSGRCLFSMDDVLRFRISEYRQTGEDLWLTLRPK